MTKITFCSYDKPGNVGGPFFWLRRLLPELRQRGLDCRCLFLTHFGGTGPVAEALIADGFQCHVIDCHDRMVDQVRWVLEKVAQDPPDVFCPNLPIAAYHASRWIRAAGIPTIGLLHSDDDYYRAILDEFVFGSPETRLTVISCVSRALEDEITKKRPPATEVWRIPYGVSVPPLVVRNDNGKLRIAYVGRLAEEQKRISDVTRALVLACQKVPSTEAVIFGDGPDRGNVEKILSENDAGGKVAFGGSIPNEQIQTVLQGFDVVTLLSDYEGLPIALLESMACGLVPVCLAMDSGISELLNDPPAGLIVADRTDSFVAAIRKLQNDTGLLHYLSVNARQRIQAEYSQDVSSDLWAKKLRAIAAQAEPRPLKIPRNIRLPRPNPHLESQRQRQMPPTTSIRGYRKTRLQLGKWRRQVLGFLTGEPDE